MSQIKIEKGVPLPKARSNGTRSEQIRSMEIGDSFVAPESLRACIPTEFTRQGFKAAVRIEPGTSNPRMVRIWRVA